MELQALHVVLVAVHVGHHGLRGLLVLLALGQVQQLVGLGQAFLDIGDAADELLQGGALAAQRLGALRVVPDVRDFQLPGDFL